ncbi:esterase-like activity of phytase family protein [Sphingomonas solaris]|uniref:Esterase-like activity of phytase family protein n=1 Tax=Alterirhizorhabdus solaris TaxID=2529389 RepID=A0A558QXS0_9SPHN|nr:esterase-like activity of phytase family protein [Sphingomonas solaris]TVV71862.1 esterase-like activity of phytase family protein [Sphingomonas solaris]
MRSTFLMPALLLATFLMPSSTPLASPIILATPVPLDRVDPARTRLGALRYLGGWELASTDPRFGGLSSMIWRNGRLLAISDAGAVFDIAVTGKVPSGAVRGMLPAGPGTGEAKSDRDAESLTADPASGRLWVGFEAHNAIWRYDAALGRAEAHVEPSAMRKWPGNGGPEAMVRLRDGRFLIFSEEAPGPAKSTALLIFPGDPTKSDAVPLLAGYRAPPGYAVTDVVALDDGRLILLHRRFTLMEGVSAIVSLLDPARIRPGHAVEATILARLAPPLTVDNMEAVAVSREGGRTILWIASDDNFSPLQRTLLLKFALVP